MMYEDFSPVAKGIIEGLNEVLADVQKPQSELKKTVVYQVKPKEIRERLHMSQSKFAQAFGIPLGTLRNWEQGTRKIDSSSMAYLRTIMLHPQAAKDAQLGL